MAEYEQDYWKQRAQREAAEAEAKAAAEVKATKEADVLAEGQKKAAKIKIGTDVALAGIKAYMRQQQINKLKAAQAADAAAMRAPVLTDKALAMASGIQSSAMRQAKAEGGRGGGGIDYERMRRAQEAGLKRGAQALTAHQEGELGRRKLVSDVATKRSEQLSKDIAAQREGIMGDAASILSDKDVVAMLGKAGKRDRTNKLAVPIEEAGRTLELEVRDN